TRCERVALTCGADGLYLAEGESMVHAVCRVESVISAVGSGDCLLAGSCAADAASLSLEETARLGAACGAANCLRPDLGMLYRKDVETLVPQTQVRRLS